jgi:hypothetical protein
MRCVLCSHHNYQSIQQQLTWSDTDAATRCLLLLPLLFLAHTYVARICSSDTGCEYAAAVAALLLLPQLVLLLWLLSSGSPACSSKHRLLASPSNRLLKALLVVLPPIGDAPVPGFPPAVPPAPPQCSNAYTIADVLGYSTCCKPAVLLLLAVLVLPVVFAAAVTAAARCASATAGLLCLASSSIGSTCKQRPTNSIIDVLCKAFITRHDSFGCIMAACTLIEQIFALAHASYCYCNLTTACITQQWLQVCIFHTSSMFTLNEWERAERMSSSN